ncbi:flagellar biosynthesis anti-sigma factor FlgM [Halomonas sp. CH40]
MKIDTLNSLLRPNQAQQRDDAQRAQMQKTTDSSAAATSETRLSQQSMDVSQDIDSAKVDEIRTAIREGRMEINPERIADGLLSKLDV